MASHPAYDRMRETERAFIGDMRHVGHLAILSDEIEGWIFRRCPCGFDLALSPTGHLYWLRKTHAAAELLTFEELLLALNKSCRFHRRPKRQHRPRWWGMGKTTCEDCQFQRLHAWHPPDITTENESKEIATNG